MIMAQKLFCHLFPELNFLFNSLLTHSILELGGPCIEPMGMWEWSS